MPGMFQQQTANDGMFRSCEARIGILRETHITVPYHLQRCLRTTSEAMRPAHYELTENARFFATIPGLKGIWAEDATLDACREELQSTLQDWIMLKLRDRVSTRFACECEAAAQIDSRARDREKACSS